MRMGVLFLTQSIFESQGLACHDDLFTAGGGSEQFFLPVA